MKIRFPLAVIACMLFASCDSSSFNENYDKFLSTADLGGVIVEYYEEGRPVGLPEGVDRADAEKILKDVLREMRGKWESGGFVSYAPKFLFTCSGLSLMVGSNRTVLNIEIKKGVWRQYVSGNSQYYASLYRLFLKPSQRTKPIDS